MIPVKIKDDVYSLRANDWDRKLFDELVPLPDGTSYNSYLIKGGDKTALIDTVYPAKTAEFIAALKATGVETIDYVVANHAELDHAELDRIVEHVGRRDLVFYQQLIVVIVERVVLGRTPGSNAGQLGLFEVRLATATAGEGDLNELLVKGIGHRCPPAEARRLVSCRRRSSDRRASFRLR